MTKQEFATLVVAMQAMYGEDFIGTEQALDVWYALLHDLDYQILSKVLQQYMLTNKFKPTVAELREIYAELVSPATSDWSEGWEQVSKAIGHYGMYQEKAAMESFDEVTREVVKRLGFQNICLSENIVADRARFAEIYQAIHRRKRTEVNVGSALPNLQEMVQKIQSENWMDFDVVVASPDMMGVVGRLGRVLGPKGLMPNPKAGTVTMDVTKAINDIKAGKIEYRLDKTNIIHVPIGKASFTEEQLSDNFQTLIEAIVKARPSTLKGQYMKSIVLTPTMGPGVKVNPAKFA